MVEATHPVEYPLDFVVWILGMAKSVWIVRAKRALI